MDRRKYPRAMTHLRIFFSDGYLEGEGTVLDLSLCGCKVQCPTEVRPPTSLALWLFMPGYASPLKLDQTEVRWKQGDVFGVEFLRLSQSQRTRLSRTLQGPTLASSP